jgi:hypothetical protein
LLTLPSNAEIYYLSGARNPTRFFNSALALLDEHDVASTIAALEKAPPKLVFFDPLDKYVTAPTESLMAWVRAHYRLLQRYQSLEIYVHQESNNVR